MTLKKHLLKQLTILDKLGVLRLVTWYRTYANANAKRSRMVNFTRPIYINQQALISVPKSSYIEYLGRVAVELFLPPLGLLALMGFVLGCILYFIEPNRGFKEATF